MGLAEPHQKPWHHRPAIIVALLVVFPPAGIALMWMCLPWSHKMKQAVSGIAGAWFVAMLVLGNARKGSEDRGPSLRATAAPEAPTAQAPVPSATTPPPPAPEPPSGLALIEHDPLLLIPAKLDGFALASASLLPPKVVHGANASYYGENKHLVMRVTVNRSNVEIKPDDQLKPIKVGDHDGTIGEDKAAKTITIAWSASGWNGLVAMDYERAVDRSAAEKAVQAVAPKIAALLDSYLTGTPPTEADRQQQLAMIAQANASAKVEEFMSKIQTAGITADLVSRASIKADVNELSITVGSTWHRVVYQERLIAAQKLWKLWADINTPSDLDTSRIQLVDVNGNRVGGSGLMGSSIKVDK